MASKKDYFGLEPLVSLILAIIPFTSWICGAITRLQEGKIVAFIVRLIGGFTVVWVLDLIFMVLNKRICRILNI
ncbi:MAG: hypothetical protein IJB34_06815 [Clostridia bacterium]|nr:hypothetical protein [Clostridia bacterium]